MRKMLILLLLVSFTGCELLKDCPEIIKGKPENHLISDNELTAVRYLITSNNLNSDNCLFYKYEVDYLRYYHVWCNQYVNNLKIFSNDLIFHFDPQGHFESLSGTIISEIDVDPFPVMSSTEARAIYLQKLDEDGSDSDSKRKIKKHCLRCELGYYDLNAGVSYTTPEFILAWKISPDGSVYPSALINDPEESLINYDNGIRY